MAERRKFSRVVYRAPATMTQGDDAWQTKILDLSLKGALLEAPKHWRVENAQEYNVHFQLHESEISIDMDVDVVQEVDGLICCKIVHIDIDSASHLKRLVELNVGNDDLLHRELAQLTDMKDIV